eukprot:6280224-Ditylum_brightwellii.AAC.1
MDLDIITVVVLAVIVEVGCIWLFLVNMTKLRLINVPCSFPSKNDVKSRSIDRFLFRSTHRQSSHWMLDKSVIRHLT